MKPPVVGELWAERACPRSDCRGPTFGNLGTPSKRVRPRIPGSVSAVMRSAGVEGCGIELLIVSYLGRIKAPLGYERLILALKVRTSL
jgi:hypothetical protein